MVKGRIGLGVEGLYLIEYQRRHKARIALVEVDAEFYISVKL